MTNTKDEQVLVRRFLTSVRDSGFNFATGIPCGAQKLIISGIKSMPEIRHVPCTRESEAIGIACGAYLGGAQPLVYMQNSGFFAASNDIASLLLPYQIPILITVTWRGIPGEDAPQHLFTGSATTRLLDALGIEHRVLSPENAGTAVTDLREAMIRAAIPTVLLIKKRWWSR